MDVLCSVPWRAVFIDTVMYCQRKVMEIDNALVSSPKMPHVRQPQAQPNYKFRCSLSVPRLDNQLPLSVKPFFSSS